MDWATLGLSDKVVNALVQRGYPKPAEVQLTLIPPLLRGENLIGQAKSGAGKTVAYAAGILNDVDLEFSHSTSDSLMQPTSNSVDPQIAIRQRLQTIVVVPTREIGTQVASEIARIAEHMAAKIAFDGCDGGCFQVPAKIEGEESANPENASEEIKTSRKRFRVCVCDNAGNTSLAVSILACVGGCPVTYDLMCMRLRRPHILVVTPGRLLTLVQDDSSQTQRKSKIVHSSIAQQIKSIKWRIPNLKNLVFDEADRLFCDSFRPQVISMANMISKLGRTRVLCYSATFPPPILNFAEKLIYDLATDTKGEGDLHVIVDGVDPEVDLPKEKILRKCFMVSSFFDQQLGVARVPLRMDVNQPVPQTSLATPTLENVECLTIAIDEDSMDFEQMINSLSQSLDLKRRKNAMNGEVREPVEVAGCVLSWMDSDFEHWPDLRMKSVALFLCIWRELDEFQKLVVFCNDLFSGLKIAQFLNHLGIRSEYISGKIDQEVRQKHLGQFRSGDLRGLVTSDLSARGLDIPEVDLVINVDLPESHDTCLHRIGRCSRFGRSKGRVYFIVRREDELRTLQLFATQTQLWLKNL